MSNLQLFNQTITNPKTQEYLAQVLGERKPSFVSNLTALVANNVALQECEPVSVMYSALKATALDLPLDSNLGFAYVIPFKDNKQNKVFAQFQIGAKGFIQLALRSGRFKTINVAEIRKGELKHRDLITGEITFEALATDREKADIIGYVAYFRLHDGFEKMLYMTSEELKAHGVKFSKTFQKGYGLWKDDFDSMASKTILKRLLSKYAPLSVEMREAVRVDQGLLKDENNVEYVDNQPVIDEKAVAMVANAFDAVIEKQ